MTPDEARQKRLAESHHAAMEACDHADRFGKQDNRASQVAFLLMALDHEHRAAIQAPEEGIARAVLYRSAAIIAHQASVELAKRGLTCDPDRQLREELEGLIG